MLRKEFDFLHSALQSETSFTDLAHVRLLFLRHNDKVLKQKSIIQQKKFNNLHKDKKPQHNAEKIIYNYSALSEAGKSLLLKGLNFSIPPKKLGHADNLVKFDLFYRHTNNLQVLSTEDLGFITTKA